MLIISMLHSCRQPKGDIKEARVNTCVKYERLKVEKKKRTKLRFNLLVLSAGEIRFWLTADVHLFKQNKEPGDAHIQIYISQLCRFQMPVSPAATKRAAGTLLA